VGQTQQDEEGNEPSPLTATDYDANGEAVDVPVDTTATQAGLPGVERDEPVEMFDGRAVTAWKYSLTGNTQVNRRNANAAHLFDGMRAELPVTLLVTVVPGAVSYKPNTEDGHVVGFTRERKLHVTEVWGADADASELFEGGLVRVRKPGDDGIGFMVGEPAEEETFGDMLADALEDMAVEPGMCGKFHNGHLNPCRQSAHACPLRQAED
jgi:hypothetical protein